MDKTFDNLRVDVDVYVEIKMSIDLFKSKLNDFITYGFGLHVIYENTINNTHILRIVGNDFKYNDVKMIEKIVDEDRSRPWTENKQDTLLF